MESNCQARRGMGREEEDEEEEGGVVAVMLKYSLPADHGYMGGNGQAAAVYSG